MDTLLQMGTRTHIQHPPQPRTPTPTHETHRNIRTRSNLQPQAQNLRASLRIIQRDVL